MLFNSGGPLPLPQGDMNHLSEGPLILDPDKHVPRRLVSCVVPQDELPSLIETVSNMRAVDIFECLRESDAQMFIDVVDEVRYRFSFPKKWPIDFVLTLGVGKP